MPTGPTQWHEDWCNFGPTDSGDLNACKLLEDRGYTLTSRYTWIMPKGIERPSDTEAYAINYLIGEWDYGGLE